MNESLNIWYFYLDPNTSLSDPGNAPAIHIKETIQALRQQGHQVKSFLHEDLPSQGENALRRTSREFSLNHAAFRAIKPLLRDLYELYQNLQETRSLENAFRGQLPNLVYERLAHNKSAVSTCAHRHDIPLIVENNAPVDEKKQYWGAPLDFATRSLEKTVLQRADAIAVVSSPLKKHYERLGIDARKIFVLSNGVNEENFSLDKVSLNIRSKLGLEEKLIIGFVGTIAPYHGVELFLSIARAKLSSTAPLHFLIVGAGHGRDELSEAVKQAHLDGQFTFINPVPNAQVPNYLAAMDICLLPRFMWYGSPMKIFEYGIMGKVIVAPNQENIRDVLTHGETALLFEPGNTDALILTIQELCKDDALRIRLGIAARKHILANHTWTKNAERILEIYHQIAD
jgi:glycosyltransferase involved in cell wall biosynthesis